MLGFSEKRRYGVRPLFTFIKQFDWKYFFSNEVCKSYLSTNFPEENDQKHKHFSKVKLSTLQDIAVKYFIHIRGCWDKEVLGLTISAKL